MKGEKKSNNSISFFNFTTVADIVVATAAAECNE